MTLFEGDAAVDAGERLLPKSIRRGVPVVQELNQCPTIVSYDEILKLNWVPTLQSFEICTQGGVTLTLLGVS